MEWCDKGYGKTYNSLLGFVLFLLGTSMVAWAQNPPLTKPGLRDLENNVAYQNPLDSLQADSLLSDIEIKPDVRTIRPEEVFLHLPTRIPVVKNLGLMPKWDELDRERGFVLSLGQIGKPYQHFLYGLQDQHLPDRHLWRNPITQRYNVYALNNSEQIPYYDTKTPYVNADFAQGSRQLSRIDATVSRNITPRWNMTLFYQGRQSEGAHLQFATSHTSVFASSYLSSKNDRYHMFANWSINELNDDLNGGVLRTLDDGLELDEGEGILRDSRRSLEEKFQKEQANLVSGDANRKAHYRQLLIDQYFHIVQPSDTALFPQRLTLRALFRAENNNHNFEDLQINTTKLIQHSIPVYPTLDTATTRLKEIYKSRSYQVLSGLSYSLDKPFRFHVDGQLSYKQITLDQDSLGIHQLNQFDLEGKGELGFSWGQVKARLHQRASNLFSPQNRLSIEGTLFPLARRPSVRTVDSAKVGSEAIPYQSPLRLSGTFARWGKNPSLLQTQFTPSEGNIFQANSSLENQQFTQLKAKLAWNPPAVVRKGDTLLPSFYYVELFSSRASQLIYYDTQMRIGQAADPLQWVGATIGLRTRVLGKTYLEGQFTWQSGSTEAQDDFRWYAEYLPEFWGKASYYYENHSLSIAAIFKLGVDVTYFSSYQGFIPDITSGEFFPSQYQVSNYVVADAYFATQIKQAYLFFKLSHANEGLLQAGYYTTPFYPMLERTFSLGISWAFFD